MTCLSSTRCAIPQRSWWEAGSFESQRRGKCSATPHSSRHAGCRCVWLSASRTVRCPLWPGILCFAPGQQATEVQFGPASHVSPMGRRAYGGAACLDTSSAWYIILTGKLEHTGAIDPPAPWRSRCRSSCRCSGQGHHRARPELSDCALPIGRPCVSANPCGKPSPMGGRKQ